MFALAAVTDYVDGPVARARGTASPRGGVLDNLADIAFVLGGAAAGAWLGLVTWVAPLAITASVSGYVRASRRLARQVGTLQLARNRIGHAAGVVNYVLAGTIAATRLPPLASLATALLAPVAWTTIAVNLAAIVARLRAR